MEAALITEITAKFQNVWDTKVAPQLGEISSALGYFGEGENYKLVLMQSGAVSMLVDTQNNTNLTFMNSKLTHSTGTESNIRNLLEQASTGEFSFAQSVREALPLPLPFKGIGGITR